MKKILACALILSFCTVNAGFKSAMKKVGKAAVSPIKKAKQKTSKLMWEKKVKKAAKKCLDISDDVLAENIKNEEIKNFRETVREWSDDWSNLLVYTTESVEKLIPGEMDEGTANKFRESAKNLVKLFTFYSSIYLEIVDSMYEEIEKTIDVGTDGRDDMLKLLQDYSTQETIRSNDKELLDYLENLEELGTDVSQLKEKFYLLKRVVAAVQQGDGTTYQDLKKDWEKLKNKNDEQAQ